MTTPSGTRGVLNDAISIYFPDAALAGAFVARWCIGYKVETAGGALRVREDEPTPRVGAGLHRRPWDRIRAFDQFSPLRDHQAAAAPSVGI